MRREGGLMWPVKASFRAYVLALPDGAAEAAYGAIAESEGFWFPASHGPESATQHFFDGEVRFGGHHGLLLVAIARPGVEIRDDTTAAITIDYPWFAAEPMPRARIASGIVTSKEGVVLAVREVRLTETGADLFGGVYSEGDLLDDLTLVRGESPPSVAENH